MKLKSVLFSNPSYDPRKSDTEPGHGCWRKYCFINDGNSEMDFGGDIMKMKSEVGDLWE